jgi:uncharacterized protein with ATP-grasp and redox domains
MKAKIDCIPCIFNQAFRTGNAATNDEKLIREILDRAGERVKDINLKLTPPEAALPVYELVEKITGNSDPYKKIKKEHIKLALEIYPLMKEKVCSSDDRLKEAIKIAIAGNAIDLGSTLETINVKEEFLNIEKGEFFLDSLEEFADLLVKSDNILYLSDNAGETVFDRPLVEEIERLGKKITYAVKERPIINDAVYEDAVLSGIDADIISTGSSVAGTVLSTCSKSFLRYFKNSDLIIAKGQGNYETLSDVSAPIFFLFKVKCNPIAQDSGFPKNSMILLKSRNFS